MLTEEYGYWTDQRSVDSEGIPCSGEMGARFLERLVGVRESDGDDHFTYF